MSDFVSWLSAIAALLTLGVICVFSFRQDRLLSATKEQLEKLTDLGERQAAFLTLQDARSRLAVLSTLQWAVDEAERLYGGYKHTVPQRWQAAAFTAVASTISKVELSMDPDPELREDLWELRRAFEDLASVAEEEPVHSNREVKPWNEIGEILCRLPDRLNERIEAYGSQHKASLSHLISHYQKRASEKG